MAFVVDGNGFTPLPLELKEPIAIARRDLVILDESKEEMEAATVSRPRRGNKAEQKASALLISALAQAAYPNESKSWESSSPKKRQQRKSAKRSR